MSWTCKVRSFALVVTGVLALGTDTASAADVVVHLDYPTRVALRGVVGRRWGQEHRPDVPEEWRERVSWELLVSVLRFRSSEASRVADLVAAAAHPPVVVRLRSRAAARRWLDGLGARVSS